jgi:signal transduction histidine kinase
MDQVNQLQELLIRREQDLNNKQEELDAQRGMLTAAIEELMKKNQSLECALSELQVKNNELSGLLYNASHGLRTPAINIQGLVQLLRSEPLNEASTEYVNYLERQSDQMVEIMTTLTSLSTISRLEKESPILEVIDLNQIIRNTISYFDKLSAAKHVKVNHLASTQSITMNSVSVVLGEIVKQLVMNGIVFRSITDDGFVNIDCHEMGGQVVLTIQDNGDGIPESIKEKIFDMFFRGSEKSGGSGLGLYLAKKAVKILNGSIVLESQPGTTTFTILLPLNN